MPAEVAVLAIVYLVSAFAVVLASFFPVVPNAPIAFERWLGAGAFAIAIGLLLGGSRVSGALLHGAVLTITLGASALISQSVTNGGMMLTAWAFAWIGIYVAFFFRGREIYLHATFVTIGCTVGVAIADVPDTFIEPVIINLTIWAGALAFGQLSERLREQADTDHLTALLNRHGFTTAATRELALAGRTGNPLALAALDLDGFKGVNDAHGHAAGDRLLAELARAWTATLRPGDLLARVGGDEFVLVMPATTAFDAHAALRRMREAHPAPWSAGVVEWERGERLEDCLARADARLYEAKSAGAGRVAGAPTLAVAPDAASV